MSMIEVDPQLFIKCRLCLDETGQYQIVPKVQMQIKYCFDIDIEPFDGLPQLVCKKCESILSQYAGIKQIFQEKQKNLKSKINSDVEGDSVTQQQQDTVSSTQVDTEHKSKLDDLKSVNIANSRTKTVSTRHSSTDTNISTCSKKSNKTTPESHKSKKQWQYKYIKHFVCRFCSKSFKDKKNLNNHITNKQCKLYTKYSNIISTYCLVGMNKIDTKDNITGSRDNVVRNKNEIIQAKSATYFIRYNLKAKEQESSTSSDEDFPMYTRKRKPRRLYSRSSNETVVIEQNTVKSSEEEKQAKLKKKEQLKMAKILSDIECVNIEDSDSNSTKSSVKTRDSGTPHKISTIHDKMLNNIITMCSSKYLKRLNTKFKENSSLKHKVLSIGRKVIHNKGINTTGLLRYTEHKNLEVVWIPNLDKKVTITTRIKESTDNENSNFGWENITSLQNNKYVTEAFVDIFERKTTLEAMTNQNNNDKSTDKVNSFHQDNISEKDKDKDVIAVLYLNSKSKLQETENNSNNRQDPPDKSQSQSDSLERKTTDYGYLKAALVSEKNWTKLLNANPVANPKQLPKKMNFGELASNNNNKIHTEEVTDPQTSNNEISADADQSNDMISMPIITSIASLAPVENDKIKNPSSDNPQQKTGFPKIKVKPVCELMSERALSQHNNSFVATTGWTVNNENQSILLQPNGGDIVYMTGGPGYTNVFPLQHTVVCYPQRQDGIAEFNPSSSVANQAGATLVTQQREYVKLHTVELPNTKTDSPFRYYQRLLKIHNIHLLDSVQETATMHCLTKFKVIFEQDSNAPVKLCLFLLCQNNEFCIKAKDHNLRDLDIPSFSANWQWEILKVFKGDDIVPKLLANALKFGIAMHDITNYFINLLRSIVFSKE